MLRRINLKFMEATTYSYRSKHSTKFKFHKLVSWTVKSINVIKNTLMFTSCTASWRFRPLTFAVFRWEESNKKARSSLSTLLSILKIEEKLL